MSRRPALRVLIQSRLSSTRLPAKALLHIRGVPAVVLCALRAANTGLDVRVVTSTDPSDDSLALTLERAGLSYFRGSLDDVLDRFVAATAELNEIDIVARLTADNLFPDGDFVQNLFDQLQARGRDYLGTSSPSDGLPYGLSAEVFTVRALRRAHREAHTAHDREHVTPWIRREYGAAIVERPNAGPDRSHLRCTMDTFEDFLRVSAVFEAAARPIEEGWSSLVDILVAQTPQQPRISEVSHAGKRWGRMVLGTAQLGLAYGAANTAGQPSETLAAEIINTAWRRGITHIDTAAAYGAAESRIGTALNAMRGDCPGIITKLSPLSELPVDAHAREVRAAVDASVLRSCHALRLRRLPWLLLHRWQHRTAFDGAVWDRLLALQREGLIEHLGASVQSPAEALAALADASVKLIQLPFNLLDWRWKAAGVHTRAAERPDVTVHARSALLQGLLVSDPAIWPALPGVEPGLWRARIETLTTELGRESAADLCLAFVLGQPWITCAVVGVETLEQLDMNCELLSRPRLTLDEIARVEGTLGGAPEVLLDPARWSRP